MKTALADWRAGFVVAIVSAVLGAIAGAVIAGPREIAASAFLAAAMGAIAVEDARRMRVPDAWSLPAAIGGFAVVTLDAGASGSPPLVAFAHAVVSLIVCGGIFYLLRVVFFRLRGVDGLGLGDVKLAAAGGVWLGWEIFPAVVTLAAFGAIVWVVAAAAMQRGWPRSRRIPFGVFLAPAIWICWIYAKSVGL